MSGRQEVLARRIATVFGLGDHLPAPGTSAGSLPAAVLWLLLVLALDRAPACFVLTVVLVVVSVIAGLWAAELEVQRRGLDDPGPVVIDEVAGQWLCYLVALPFAPATMLEQVLFVGAGFLLFRFFDITKIWPANRLERLHGGLGIMADDLAAGVWAGLCLAVAARWLPWAAALLGSG